MRLQEIKKTRIVIASILKPVDDTRMFEKIGQTLAEEGEVHIIGYPSQAKISSSAIISHPLLPFKRLSVGRMLASWRILQKVLAIKPTVFIITTHELLMIGVLSKILLSCRLIYDVQENYARNILYTKAFPKLLRPSFAAYVRGKEWITSPFVNQFLLAERGYEKELNFLGNKKTVIENKTKKQEVIPQKKIDGYIHLLFTGTLAETTGVFTAIELAKQLHSINPSIRLTIIGYCSLQTTFDQIRNTIRDKKFIQLIGGDQLVPHSEIVREIQSSDFGIIAYAENPSTINAIPTKLYEYLGYQLPILMIDHPYWVEIACHYQAAITFNPSNLKPDLMLDHMKNQAFYTAIPENVFWESEAIKLKKILPML